MDGLWPSSRERCDSEQRGRYVDERLTNLRTVAGDAELVELVVVLRPAHIDNDDAADERAITFDVTQQHDCIRDRRDVSIGDSLCARTAGRGKRDHTAY